MTVPTKRGAFIADRLQLWEAAAGTALPGTLDTSSTGKVALNEQLITLPSGATGGDFTLTYNGVTTSALTYDESAADIATALNGLSSLGAGQVEVTGSDGGPWTVAFVGSIGQAGYPELLTITDSTTGGSGSASIARVRTYLGWTEGATEIGINESYAEHKVNEILAAVDHSPEDESATLKAMLAEATLTRWHEAMQGGTYATQAAGASQTGYEKLGFGGADEADPVQICGLTRNRSGYNQLWVLHRVVRQINAGPSFQKGNHVVVPVNGVLQFDPSQPAGHGLFTVYNITDLPTS